jgi:hypothetical protein
MCSRYVRNIVVISLILFQTAKLEVEVHFSRLCTFVHRGQINRWINRGQTGEQTVDKPWTSRVISLVWAFTRLLRCAKYRKMLRLIIRHCNITETCPGWLFRSIIWYTIRWELIRQRIGELRTEPSFSILCTFWTSGQFSRLRARGTTDCPFSTWTREVRWVP